MAAHRYWRISITAAYYASGTGVISSYGDIASLEMRETVGGTNLAVPGNGTPFGSAANGVNLISHAFDSNATTLYRTPTNTVAYLGWDFGAGNGRQLSTITLVNSVQDWYASCFTKDFTVDYSDDGSTWTPTLAVTGRANTASLSVAYTLPATFVASLTAPSASAALSGVFGWQASVAAPQPALLARSGGYATFTAPTPLLSVVVSNKLGKDSAFFNAPVGGVLAYFGFSAELGAPKGSLTGNLSSTALLQADVSAPIGSIAATVAVAGIMRGAMIPTAGMLIGYGGALIAVTTPVGTLRSSFNSGAVMHGEVVAPLFSLSAGLSQGGKMDASLLSPMLRRAGALQAWLIAPDAKLTAIGSATVTATYEAYALNLNHRNPDSPDELTRYTNYPFDRIVRYENSYFGMNATGLYLLEGTTDFAEPTPTKVPWRFKTGLTDFESPNLKTVNWAYFGGRMAPAATISIHYGDTGEQNYAYSTPRGAEAQNYRQPFGRGIKSRYYAVEAEGSGALSIDSMMFDIASMARKV